MDNPHEKHIWICGEQQPARWLYQAEGQQYSSPFYYYGLILIWAWITITSIIKCRMKLLIHSQTSTVEPVKFGNEEVISSHTLMGMPLLIYAGIKVEPH